MHRIRVLKNNARHLRMWELRVKLIFQIQPGKSKLDRGIKRQCTIWEIAGIKIDALFSKLGSEIIQGIVLTCQY